MDWDAEVSHEERALEVLIGMTAKTLCRRSNSHLEQALLLVELTLHSAHVHWGMLVEQHRTKVQQAAEAKEAEGTHAAEEAAAKDTAAKAADKAEGERAQLAGTGADASSSSGPAATEQPVAGTPQPVGTAEPSTTAGAGASTAGAAAPARHTAPVTPMPGASSSGRAAAAGVVIPELSQHDNPGPVIQSLPERLLQQLARLLGQSGLSEVAQKRCASVIRMLVDTCPQLKPLMLSELQNELQR